MPKLERIVFKPDTHAPWHDPRAYSLFLKIVEHIRPHRVIDLGDAVCFDDISHWPRFEQDPTIAEEASSFGDNYEQLRAAAGPRCRFQFIEGNHEFRLRNYVWGSARGLASLECTRLRNVLGFEKHRIEGPFDQVELAGGRFVAIHGRTVRKWPGATANEHITNQGRSGICGHVHRLAIVGRRFYSGNLVWAEGGFLGRLDQRYTMHGGQQVNQQHGFIWGQFSESDFQLHEVRFHDNYSWRSPEGREFRA